MMFRVVVLLDLEGGIGHQFGAVEGHVSQLAFWNMMWTTSMGRQEKQQVSRLRTVEGWECRAWWRSVLGNHLL